MDINMTIMSTRNYITTTPYQKLINTDIMKRTNGVNKWGMGKRLTFAKQLWMIIDS